MSVDLTYIWQMFQGFFTTQFLMILPLLLPVLWLFTKFTFIGIILYNIPLHCKGKIICNICIFPTRNWYIYWIILEDTIYMRKDNLQHLYIYLQETDTFIGMRIFPTVHHQKLLCLQRNPHYYPRIFYQFMYTNQYFLNTTLISSDRQTDRHAHTHTRTHAHITHISLRVPFLSLNFCVSNMEFGYLNNLKYLNEWW